MFGCAAVVSPALHARYDEMITRWADNHSFGFSHVAALPSFLIRFPISTRGPKPRSFSLTQHCVFSSNTIDPRPAHWINQDTAVERGYAWSCCCCCCGMEGPAAARNARPDWRVGRRRLRTRETDGAACRRGTGKRNSADDNNTNLNVRAYTGSNDAESQGAGDITLYFFAALASLSRCPPF